jgi:Mor family transcriptional regulator
MKKVNWQFLVDTSMFICMVGIAVIGILLAFFIPQGPSSPDSSKYFLNLHRHQWGNIHLYLSITFVLLLIIHLTLDWKWIKSRAYHIFKGRWKMALGSTFLLSLLVLFIIWIVYPKEPGAYEEYGLGRGRLATENLLPGSLHEREPNSGAQEQETLTVTGQMTLKDLEELSGVPASRIIEALGLPSNSSEKETLGRLRKKYGLSLVEMRDVLTRLMNEETEKSGPKTPVIEEAAEIQDEEEEKPVHGRLEEQESGLLITGQMSLSDIQAKTGISARQIADELDLPPDVPVGESLGRLRKAYYFSVEDVREAINRLLEKEGKTAREILIQHEAEEFHAEEQKITQGRMAEDQSGILITGQMSLSQIERQTGVSSQKIIEKLGLPRNVSLHENIGRLRRRYGFTLVDLRDAVASLMKKR